MAKSKTATAWKYVRPLLNELCEQSAAAGSMPVGVLLADPKRGLILAIPNNGGWLFLSGSHLTTEMEGTGLAFGGWRDEPKNEGEVK